MGEKEKKHKFKGLVANSDRLMSGTEGLESPNTIWQTWKETKMDEYKSLLKTRNRWKTPQKTMKCFQEPDRRACEYDKQGEHVATLEITETSYINSVFRFHEQKLHWWDSHSKMDCIRATSPSRQKAENTNTPNPNSSQSSHVISEPNIWVGLAGEERRLGAKLKVGMDQTLILKPLCTAANLTHCVRGRSSSLGDLESLCFGFK